MPENIITNNEIIFYADGKFFSINAINKCLYWYSAKFNITVKSEHTYYKISLKIKNKDQNLELKEELSKLEKDMIDFNLREIVSAETKNIRELLIAKAFSYEIEK